MTIALQIDPIVMNAHKLVGQCMCAVLENAL